MGNQADKQQPHYCFHVVHIRVDSSEEERRCRNFITEMKEQLAQFLAETTMPRQEAHDTIHEVNDHLSWVYHMFDPTSLTLYDSDLKYGVQNRPSSSSSTLIPQQADLVFLVFHLKRTISTSRDKKTSTTSSMGTSSSISGSMRSSMGSIDDQQLRKSSLEDEKSRESESLGDHKTDDGHIDDDDDDDDVRRRRRRHDEKQTDDDDDDQDDDDDEEEDLKGEQYYQVVKWALHLLAEKTEATKQAVKRNNVILVLLKEIEADQEQLCGRHGERKPFPDPPSDHPIIWNLKPDWREISPSRFVLYPGFPNPDKEIQQRKAGAPPVCSPTVLQLLYKPHSFVQWSMFTINTRPILAFKRYFVSKWQELRKEKMAALLPPSPSK